MTTVSVIVPWRHSPDRIAGWAWLRKRWLALHPGWELIETPGPDGPWNKAAAVNQAARKATGNVLIMADADCIVPHTTIRTGVTVADGGRWVVPHGQVHRLTRPFTRRLLAKPSTTRLPAPPVPTIRGPVQGVAGGGIFIIRRDQYWAAGGMDETFHGWGGEDTAFACAADTLTEPHMRLGAPMLHLWHRRGPRHKHPTYTANHERVLRYKNAIGDRQAMTTLLTDRP